MSALPTGTVTFLFTDIEGSTRLWEQRTAEMKVALARHDQILRHAIESSQGYVFKTVGDAFCAVFDTAIDGLHAVLDAQRALVAEPWKVPGGIKVRMGLHTGAAEERDHDYFGQALNRTARLFSTGAGGQILVSLVTAELLRDGLPEDVALRDLGAHRLKDLMRPESIFQVVAPGLGSDFPPLKSLDNHPNNLPMQPNPFIGREKELESASRAILGDACRVLTFTGVGGTGKTRLALQAAANLTEHFPDGVYFVDLSAIDSPAFVLPAVARTLELQVSGGRSALEVLRDALQERSILLVLDNFEQVMRGVANVVELLAACPMLKIIVTSREALHIRAEKVLPIPPLSAPKVRGAREIRLAHLGQYESVSLFIERARAVRPDFSVTNESAPAIAEICARLDGLPLAIELAAARVVALTPRAILERLGSRLKLLTGGPADLPFRQRTLRTTIDWSYRMLSPVEQMLFREMSAFAGGATLPAIEAVCACGGDTDVLETLSSLVGKSLVWRVEDAGSEPRYQMFETMKEYALELVPEAGLAELQSRHANHFLEFAERHQASLLGPRQRESFDRYEKEHDNFQAALEWLERSGSRDPETRLCVALTSLWQVRGYATEGVENLQRLLPALANVEPRLRGRALLSLAQMVESQERYQDGLEILDRSEEALGASADPQGLAEVAYERGWCWYRLNRQDRALSYYQSVLDSTAAGARLQALARLGIGSSKCMTGEMDEAREILAQCKVFFSGSGDDRSLARTLLSILMISYQQEDFEAAIAVCREALSVQERLNDQYWQIVGSNNLGSLHLHLRQYEEARQIYERLVSLAGRSGNRSFICWGYAGIAESSLGLGDLEAALDHAEKASALAAALDTPFPRGVSLRIMGEVHLRQGHLAKALEEFAGSVPLIEKGEDKVEYRRALSGMEKARALMDAASRGGTKEGI